MSDTTPIWRDYDRAALDAQYNNRKRFPNYVEHFDAWQRWSRETRAAIPGHLDIAFGPSPVEKPVPNGEVI
jgi:arylformamidase